VPRVSSSMWIRCRYCEIGKIQVRPVIFLFPGQVRYEKYGNDRSDLDFFNKLFSSQVEFVWSLSPES
jgi:hypothetical protein